MKTDPKLKALLDAGIPEAAARLMLADVDKYERKAEREKTSRIRQTIREFLLTDRAEHAKTTLTGLLTDAIQAVALEDLADYCDSVAFTLRVEMRPGEDSPTVEFRPSYTGIRSGGDSEDD